ncbi:hypothetical protein KGP25_24540 (plasmid) [Enterobacter sp. JBIWA003]|uniref:hypothetical protein n=1 Tax=Enterobacter sp. JBIWA003 TaxID=2831890 RepID=UPI001CBD55C6|nr:hypothetical protein [Enterobacter sp. JBIWA003]UAN24834.1 hypothetical protein KGP25_24540 [Enterobacter sp. JBIWA003]
MSQLSFASFFDLAKEAALLITAKPVLPQTVLPYSHNLMVISLFLTMYLSTIFSPENIDFLTQR